MSSEHSSSDIHASTSSFFSYMYLIILAASLAGNIFLGQNLIKYNHSLVFNAPPIQVEGKTGNVLSALDVKTTKDKPLQVKFKGDKDTLVYIFSPVCHWCAINLKSIQALAAQRHDSYNIVGISILPDSKSLNDYLAKNDLPFQSYIDSNPQDLEKLGFIGTPQTLLIRKDGTVEHNWRGAYGGEVAKSVGNYFAVKLPDISKYYGAEPQNIASTQLPAGK